MYVLQFFALINEQMSTIDITSVTFHKH